MPPSRCHSLTASLPHCITPSQRRFVNLSPHSSLPHSVASSISHLTAYSDRSLAPSRPHPVRSLASLMASLAQIYASTQIWRSEIAGVRHDLGRKREHEQRRNGEIASVREIENE
uniref:Uncharacterized protein n=1 Tax=Fagus sylvatica TaxID=28930 RepID=A0A2N9IX69_FAGSY